MFDLVKLGCGVLEKSSFFYYQLSLSRGCVCVCVVVCVCVPWRRGRKQQQQTQRRVTYVERRVSGVGTFQMNFDQKRGFGLIKKKRN
jgi:hypothetical protein